VAGQHNDGEQRLAAAELICRSSPLPCRRRTSSTRHPGAAGRRRPETLRPTRTSRPGGPPTPTGPAMTAHADVVIDHEDGGFRRSCGRHFGPVAGAPQSRTTIARARRVVRRLRVPNAHPRRGASQAHRELPSTSSVARMALPVVHMRRQCRKLAILRRRTTRVA